MPHDNLMKDPPWTQLPEPDVRGDHGGVLAVSSETLLPLEVVAAKPDELLQSPQRTLLPELPEVTDPLRPVHHLPIPPAWHHGELELAHPHRARPGPRRPHLLGDGQGIADLLAIAGVEEEADGAEAVHKPLVAVWEDLERFEQDDSLVRGAGHPVHVERLCDLGISCELPGLVHSVEAQGGGSCLHHNIQQARQRIAASPDDQPAAVPRFQAF
eukprot:765386-Hanusia_phi.AAC.11